MELILERNGASLSVKNGMFHIRHDDGTQDIPVDKVTTITLGRAVMVTTEALMLAIENEIDVLLVDRKGQPVGRFWSARFGSVSTIRKNQLLFSRSADAVNWIKNILCRKLENMTALLLTLTLPDHSNERDLKKTITEIDEYKEKVLDAEASALHEIAPALRGWEGSAARAYFACIGRYLPEQYRFEKRSQHPAFDMFNCLLNYAYGILYGKTESALIKAGIDPYIGIFHRDEYNRPVMVYDFIEQFRVWADYVVIHLCMQQVIFPEFFDIENGVYYLNAPGKRILVQSFNDYLDEITLINGLERSRATHLELAAQQLATTFKNYHPS